MRHWSVPNWEWADAREFTEEALSPARHSCGSHCPPPASLLLSLYWNCRLLWFHLLAQIENVVQVEISLIQNSLIKSSSTLNFSRHKYKLLYLTPYDRLYVEKGRIKILYASFPNWKRSNSETLGSNHFVQTKPILRNPKCFICKSSQYTNDDVDIHSNESPVIAVKTILHIC